MASKKVDTSSEFWAGGEEAYMTGLNEKIQSLEQKLKEASGNESDSIKEELEKLENELKDSKKKWYKLF